MGPIQSRVRLTDVKPGVVHAYRSDRPITVIGLAAFIVAVFVEPLAALFLGALLTWNFIEGIRAVRDLRDFESYIQDLHPFTLEDMSLLDAWFPWPKDESDSE